jgi:hypothetical protein
MSISFDDLIPAQKQTGGISFDDLIPATPPQGEVSASPAVAENSGLVGGEATGTVQRGFQLPPVMDPFGINKPVDPEVQNLMNRYPAPPAPPNFVQRMGKSFGTGIEQGKAAMGVISVNAQDNQIKQNAARLAALEAQGKGETPEANGLRRIIQHYETRQGSALADLAKQQQTLSSSYVYPGVKALGEAKSFGDAWNVLSSDPINIIANLGSQSLPAMAPGLVVGAFNPLAGAITMGASSAGVELGSSLMQFAQENGINTADPESLKQFFATPGMLAEARKYAATRAGIIGTADALSAGIASKTLVPKAIVNPAARIVTNTAVQMPVQAIAGASGEAGAQLATKGEIDSPGEVVAEGAGGLFTAPIEVGAMATGAARAGREQRQEPTQPPVPPVRERIEPTLNFDDLIPPSTNQPGEADGNQVQGQEAAQAPAVLSNEPTLIDPASVGTVDPTPAPAVAPAAPVAAAAPGEPAPSVAPTQPEPSAALTPPVGNDAPQSSATPTDTQRVSTVTGRQVETRMRVVDASELQAATGDLQPRDRSRASSDEQINTIASQLDPQRLGFSSEADRGAPIIGPDMIVESGNGRVMAIRRAFEMFPERAQAYRDYLASQGYDTTGVAMPVLVRERVTPMTLDERRAFVQEANQAATMALTPVEQANMDTAAMTDSVVDAWRGGDVGDAQNRDFVSAFVGALPQAQRNALLDGNNRLSPDGATRIRRALLAAAYDDRDLLTELIESADDNIRSIGNALFDSAAPWLQMRRMARDGVIDQAYDTTAQLVQAARTVSQLRRQRQNIKDWLAQDDLASERDPVVDAFVRGFYNEGLTRAVGRDAINDVLQAYVRIAKEQDTGSMFGDTPTPTQLAQGAVEQRNERNKAPEQQGLLDAAAGDVRPGQGVQQRGRQAQDSTVQRGGARPDRQGQQEPLLDAADTGRPAQGAGTQGRGNQAGAGEVNERASVPAGRDTRAKATARQEDAVDDAPKKNQRVKGAGAQDQFIAASFTNRQSIYRDAFAELGLPPEQAELLPPARQFEILSKGLKATYGLAFVQKSDPANLRESIDQLLDAYRGMQLMTHVLDLPTKAIGLDGKMGLALIGQGSGFLGAYFPAGGGGKVLENLQTFGPTIAMPGRSNSFAHEWGHALDYFIADKYQGALADLSGLVRKGESLSDQMPDTVADSFRLLMNALFFDNATLSGRIMDLERRIEAAAFKGIDATALKAELAQLQSGASKSRQGRSQFYQTSGDFAIGQGGDPTYWRKPTEMLARSFEAYVAHRIEAVGGTTEFVAKGDYAYQSNANDRLAMTFPKDSDRFNIFRAYDLLFDAIRAEALLGDGPAATMPANIRLSDPTVYFDDQIASAQSSVGKALWEAEKRAWQVSARRQEKIDARPQDDRPRLKRMSDGVRAILETNRGVLLSMQAHYAKTNPAAAKAIREVTKRIATDPGNARETYADGTFAEAVQRESNRLMTRLANIGRTNNLDLFTDTELAELSDVLTAIEFEGLRASTKVAEAAAPLRELVNDLYYYNRNAGLDIGYVENGYLPRLMDDAIVTERADEFVRDATKVYQIVFERDTQRPGDADDVVLALRALEARMKEANLSIKSDPDLRAYAEARKELNKLVRALNAANAEGDADAIDTAQAALEEFISENMDVFESTYDYVRDEWSAQAAAEYQTRISYGSPENFSSHSPAGSFLKERTLPPEADKILAKYYIQDPMERISTYVQQSVRKAEYNRRFGIDSRGNEKNTKLYQFLNTMVEAGVRKEDRDMVEKIVAQVTGTDRSSMPNQAQRTLGAVHAIGQMTLLGRVVLTSLAEPITAAMQTGRPLDAFKAVGLTLQEIAATGSVRERRAMANVLGIVTGDLSNELISNRLGGTVGESGAVQRVSAQFFRRVGLTGLTNAQRRAAMQLSGRYVLDMANAIGDDTVSAKQKAYARDELIDAGLTQDQIDDFVQWGREYDSRMPRHDELMDGDGSLTAMGKVYAIMVGRLVNQAIQNPTAIDRPWAANTPIGRMTFGLLSFSMAFYRNVVIRSGKRVIREYEKRGAGQAAYVAGVQVLAPLATLYMGHLLVTVAREALLNPDKWEEEEKKEGGFPVKWLMQLAFSRAGFTGLADPLYNALLGVKYQRDLSNLLVGPTWGYFMQAMQRIATYFVANSENTNSAERAAARGLFELVVQPTLAYGAGYLPGGPIWGYGLGSSYAYFSSPAFKSQWQDWLAGEADTKKSKTGQQDKTNTGGW